MKMQVRVCFADSPEIGFHNRVAGWRSHGAPLHQNRTDEASLRSRIPL